MVLTTGVDEEEAEEGEEEVEEEVDVGDDAGADVLPRHFPAVMKAL